ncbi:hypothetical protein G6O69_06430 [Pseudenhygromyxa sp. WMMC2535]|uniref:DUF7682 family zinc-binding protein n=1 Tax=Pseudenhygromyxa sp. WMMC2535 TaxID=2712867 RepID=UPI001555124F|nr:hypothetical protein [Pseudenhygromyxa sp. WMMC2535]NVB37461.1 hypothetical protein [Pseudenhygromyxa sp. WMMC2535]
MSRKKTFPCGHRGKGSFCLICATKEQRGASASEEAEPGDEGDRDPRDEKREWLATFEDDPIDLHVLPSKNLVLRARTILDAVSKGAPWHQFNGKRLRHDRDVISVPIGRRYRLLFRTDEGSPQPVEVLSHENYNATKPGRR